MAAKGEVSLAAEELELGKLLALARVLLAQRDHIEEVVGEDERDSLTVDAKLFLEVSEKVAKVDVKYLPVFVDLEMAENEIIFGWCMIDGRSTGRPEMAHTWLQECCRQVEAEVVSNSRDLFPQTTCEPFAGVQGSTIASP